MKFLYDSSVNIIYDIDTLKWYSDYDFTILTLSIDGKPTGNMHFYGNESDDRFLILE